MIDKSDGPPFTVERYGSLGESIIAERDWLRSSINKALEWCYKENVYGHVRNELEIASASEQEPLAVTNPNNDALRSPALMQGAPRGAGSVETPPEMRYSPVLEQASNTKEGWIAEMEQDPKGMWTTVTLRT